MKNVSESSPCPSLMTTSSSEPLRFCIRRSLARRTSATIVTGSPIGQRRDRRELTAPGVPTRIVREQIADRAHAERLLEGGRRLAADGAVEARLESEGGHAPSLGRRADDARPATARWLSRRCPIAMSERNARPLRLDVEHVDPDAVARDDHLLACRARLPASQLAHEVRAEVVRYAARIPESAGSVGRPRRRHRRGAAVLISSSMPGRVADDPVAAERERRVRRYRPDEAATAVALQCQIADRGRAHSGVRERAAVRRQVRRCDGLGRARASGWAWASRSASATASTARRVGCPIRRRSRPGRRSELRRRRSWTACVCACGSSRFRFSRRSPEPSIG